MKKILSIMALFVISLLAVSMVAVADSTSSTLGDLTEEGITVEVNGDEVEEGVLLNVEEGEVLDIEVQLKIASGEEDARDLTVVAALGGYDHDDDLDDSAHVYEVEVGTSGETVNLELTVPRDFANGPALLRVYVFDGESSLEKTFELNVRSPRHSVDVVDVDFSPGSTVKAGRSLLTTVLVENFGKESQDDVKVTVAIPALGVSASEFIDNLEESDDEGDNSENVEMFLQIPATAEEGDYAVEVTVKYDGLRESVTKSYTLHVLANSDFANQDKLTVLQVGPESETVGAGKTASYVVALTNAGSTSRAYTVEAVAGDWAEISVSEKMVVLEPGKNQLVYIDVAVANDAAAGEHLVSVTVKSGSEALETVVLKANVVDSNAQTDSISLRNGLEIALVVLVVLLVVLGLIIGFSRLRKDDDEEQTYY